jgi:GNAT superfamily N-acetyltransferase
MEVIEVNRAKRRDVRDFINLPFSIYRDIPQWVPPLMSGERSRFRADYAFYKHSEAAFFLVRDENKKALGRVAVLNHRPHNEYRHKRDALIYLYEAVDDHEVARLLFDAVEAWARRRGLDRLVGPKGFLTGDSLGLLVEGFDHRPAMGVGYNPAYYVEHWETVGGMVKEVDYVSGYVAQADLVYPERIRRIAEKIRERRGFYVPAFKTKAQVRQYARVIQRAYNQAFASVWAYTPIPDEELEALIGRLVIIAKPELMKLIFKGGELIGFSFAHPDLSAAIQRIKGRLYPFGWLALLRERRRTEWLNLNGNAVLPAYQGLGANAILYDELFKTVLGSPYRHVDVVQMQEDNTRMLADLVETTKAKVYKRHRVYKKELG